jgi:hypothetical protein
MVVLRRGPVPMAATPPRRFTLADAMILVAATALGIAISREGQRSVSSIILFLDGIGTPDPFARLKPVLSPPARGIVAWGPVLTCWALALLALRLRRPRPGRRRLFASPGVAACFFAVLLVAFRTAESAWTSSLTYDVYGADLVWSSLQTPNLPHALQDGSTSATVGFGVAALWIWMAVSGRWRPEPHWIDRMGRILGVTWLVVIPLRLWFDVFR